MEIMPTRRSPLVSGPGEFWHPTCVLKWSGDDVEDRQHEACSTSDGGRPSGFAVQAEIPNHRKLRRLRAGVVSVAVKVPRVWQVGDEKTNVCEPLLTHRNKQRRHRNRTVWGGPGQRRALRGASSTGERPACGPGGVRCIGGVSSSQALVWNRRTCRPDSDGREWVRLAYWSREGEPQAVMAASGRVPMRGHRGGPVRSSDEGPVMGLERRGRAVHGQREVNPVGVGPAGEEPRVRPEPTVKSFEINKRLI
jgi:hypothetical protein